MVRISVIVPVRNDAACLRAQSASLESLQKRGCEVIVVDGESSDESAAVARQITGDVLVSAPGRARQMNAGAAAAGGEILLFLHADTEFPSPALDEILHRADAPGRPIWGRFDVRLRGDHWFFRVVETMMNLRSRFTGIATGDQAIFVSRELFHRAGGYPDIPLMEDIALCRVLLRGAGRPLCLRQRVAPSTRRWARHGKINTTLLMWRLRLAFFFGASPARLARIYYGRTS